MKATDFSFLVLGTLTFISSIAFAKASPELEFLQSETDKVSTISESEFNQLTSGWNKSMSKTNTASLKDSEDRRLAFKKVALANEDLINQLEKTQVLLLRQAIEKMDVSLLSSNLATDFEFSSFESLISPKFKTLDGIQYVALQNFSNKNGDVPFLASFKNYLASFKKIEFADAKLTQAGVGYSDMSAFADIYLPSAKSAVATAFIEIRGIMPNGFRRTDKLTARISFLKKDKGYILSGLTFKNFVTARLTREPSFKMLAQNAGFDSGKTYNRLEALRRGGYAFAVEDFNNDGKLDAFVGNYGASAIWSGQDDGSFKEINMEAISAVTLAKAAAFVDLDNDGWKDLVVTRFAADNLTGDILVFKNDHGNFIPVKNAFPSDILRDYAMPMAIADFNNDGLLDIYVGFPGVRDFSAGPAPSHNLTAHGLFLNRGGFKFMDDTKNIAMTRSGIAPHGALASDVDMDGRMDIVIMDDQKNLSPVYHNNGDGTFTEKNKEMKIMNYGYGMGLAAGDFNRDGQQDYVLSNATFSKQSRLLIPFSNGFDFAGRGLNNGIRLFYNGKNGFSENTQSLGLLDTGEGAGGATTIDYDSDGLQDIYLVNGLWSGANRDESIDSIFSKATHLDIVNLNHLQDGSGERSPDGTKSIFMKILQSDKNLSFGGYQRNRLFKNLGDGEFLEVGYLEGVDSISDGYMSVVADLNHDGKPDLLLRNCDPGSREHSYPVIEVFQNQHIANKSIWLTLKGTRSNSSGVGAKIFASVGPHMEYREMIANNSAAQGEISAHIGLGIYSVAKQLKIVWPSGIIDIYKNVAAGHHTYTEKAVPAMKSISETKMRSRKVSSLQTH